MGLYNRDQVLSDLRKNVIEITFEKINGERGTMRCTLMPNYLPASYRNNIEEQKQEETFHNTIKDSIAVWDINNAGWRSFRIDSVIYVQVIDHM
jgi:hypothetical protein